VRADAQDVLGRGSRPASQGASAGGSCASTRNRIRPRGGPKVILPRGELQGGADSSRLEIGKIPEDVFTGSTCREEVEDVFDTDALRARGYTGAHRIDRGAW
jgi:hypothetical protein